MENERKLIIFHPCDASIQSSEEPNIEKNNGCHEIQAEIAFVGGTHIS